MTIHAYGVVVVTQITDEEAQKMHPAIKKAAKQKFELISANHPADYWENLRKAMEQTK